MHILLLHLSCHLFLCTTTAYVYDAGRDDLAELGVAAYAVAQPVNGLDPEGILWIRHLLQDLAREGRTVFVSSHLMSEMELMADHFVVIGRGRLLADASREEMERRALGEHVLVASDGLGELVATHREDGVVIQSDEHFRARVSRLDAAAIGMVARDLDVALAALVPERRTLEDVFMEMTADAVEYAGGELAGAAR